MKKMIVGSLIAAAFALTACGSQGAKESVAAKPAEITVTAAEGETTIPLNPKKVVVFDNSAIDTMDALGVGDRIIGAATTNMPDYLEAYQTVDSAGGIKEPDLEKINQMQPDLIIISGRQKDFEKELSAIAPTLFLSVDATDTWQSIQNNILIIGEIFDKKELVEEKITELSQKITKTKEQAEATEEKALIVLVNEGSLSAYGMGSRFGIIHDTFGFPTADDNIEASTHGQSVSYEYLLEKNPDILFVIDRTKAIGGDTSESQLVENQLVQQTNAGKNGKVINLDPQVWYLSGSGLESLEIMLEDVNQVFE
ncbi:siderophore ABC transporter substrate-binding protein [Enterococcus sp. JM9B]|uniref:siderophore ABC transporter substrate-binding protein n=1 Tax=Enterococcus sp. JM9B TaxID=1857216 RepID=UPI001374A58F|nr:siderophore ABC transporter substrate-binding protein [Enterococcus sp. JM9B]KAF1301228.1 iron ABC transporter substrate-binding protein [Enterococcus sp. JM9B]